MSQNAKRLLAAGLAAISIAAVPATSLALGGSTAGAQLACGSNSGGGCAA